MVVGRTVSQFKPRVPYQSFTRPEISYPISHGYSHLGKRDLINLIHHGHTLPPHLIFYLPNTRNYSHALMMFAASPTT